MPQAKATCELCKNIYPESERVADFRYVRQPGGLRFVSARGSSVKIAS